jgi:hypothetical protein
LGSGEVGAWVNEARTPAGLIISYFHLCWAQVEGTEKSAGIQAEGYGVFFLFIVLLQMYGKRLRV